MALDKIIINRSALTERIRLCRIGKTAGVALETRDATNEAVGAVIEHVLANDGALTVNRSDGAAFKLTVERVSTTASGEG